MPAAAPQVALLTPPGRSAIATVVVDGDTATGLVNELFLAANGRPLDRQPTGRIVFGRWGSDAGEELVVCRRSASRVEIHCHGGAAAPTAVVESLVNRGAVAVDWRTWLADHAVDPLAAEAQIALASAPTTRTAAILLDQMDGALRRELTTIADLIRQPSPQEARKRIGVLLARAPAGRHLTRPWHVVLAGPPNVGKSSLINALLGFARAIVFDQPGTTRDVVTATTAVDGWPIQLADTAGLRASTDPIEAAGVSLATNRAAGADLLILLTDASEPWTDENQTLLDQYPGALLVHNKSDLPAAHGQRPPGLTLSAQTGQGLPELEQELAARLVPDPPAPGEPVPFTAALIESLRQADAALTQEQWEAAANAVASVLG